MAERKRVALKDFARLLKKDLNGVKKKVIRATHTTARRGAKIAARFAPVAFGEIRDGIVDVKLPSGALIVSTAPYSAAVEIGSRPHMPPIAPILRWVKLRGMQGLTSSGRITKKATVGREIAKMIRAEGSRKAVPIDAALSVAWAIAWKIKRDGTKPTWFMRNTFNVVSPMLDAEISRLLRGPTEAPATAPV
jgi:hypothetical protein